MKKFFKKISYAIFPFLIFVFVLFASYFLNQLITSYFGEGSYHYGTTYPHIALDDKIPIVSEFIYVYYLTFPIGIITFFYLAYKNKTKLFDIFVTLCLSFAISGVIYFFFQSRFIKPDFTPQNFTDKLVVWTWNSTNPTNCFPSQHCFMAIAVFIGCADCKDMKLWYRIFGCIIGILIVLATVFTRQHYLLDFVASFVIMVPIFLLVRFSGYGKITEQRFDNFYLKIRKKMNKEDKK
jgi:membrane-associated phospholipid phosphatase